MKIGIFCGLSGKDELEVVECFGEIFKGFMDEDAWIFGEGLVHVFESFIGIYLKLVEHGNDLSETHDFFIIGVIWVGRGF
jgi:hypothetical protein